MTEQPQHHAPITETHYCYCLDCIKKVADYMNRWANERYKRVSEHD